MDANNISISSEKEKSKNISNIHVINQNKSNNNNPSITNNTSNIINSNDNNNNSSLNTFNFINAMPFENLNNYYDIESSLFLKRIEKLNLKFYWTSESVLNQQDIKYPYNKLFLILFKQISLYIEEISRLNKQLKQKNKNEKHFQIKIAQMRQKEKEYILNKQMLKNLQRDNKLLEKKNEKNMLEIEKLNKKLLHNKNLNFSGSNTTTNLGYSNSKERDKYNKFLLVSPKSSNNSIIGYDSIITHGSVKSKHSYMSNEYNKNAINVNTKIKDKRISNSIDDAYIKSKKNNIEIINHGINQCDEEIGNLEIIEEMLKEFKNKNINNINPINNSKNRNHSSTNVVNPKNTININNMNNHVKFKKDKVYNKSGIPIKKHFHLPHKSDDLSKK